MIIQGYSGSGLTSFVSRFQAGGIGRSGDSAASLVVGRSGEESREISRTFAHDIVSRLGVESFEPDTGVSRAKSDETTQIASDKVKDSSGLEESLARAIDYVGEKFGDKAATAFMALVYKRVGSDQLSEDNLGQGLLAGLKLIDSQFGVSAGDKLINFLNQDLNQEVNEYFDNGRDETFFAVESEAESGQGMSLDLSGLGQRFSQKSAGVMDLLEQSLEGGEVPLTGEDGGADQAGQIEDSQTAALAASAYLQPWLGSKMITPSGLNLDLVV